MEKNKILPIIISLIIIFFGIFFFINPKKAFSENENRFLTKFPNYSFDSLKEGTYTEKIKDYTADHFPFRDAFMYIKTTFDKLLGKKDINNVYLGSDEYLLQKYEKPLNTDKIINTLNNFYDKINYTNMSLMLVPTSITINEDKLPNFALTYDQLETMKNIYDNLKFNDVDVSEILKNDEYQMYYRLDHHWTTYGAFMAYQKYCQDNNINPYKISDFDIKEVTSKFNGTLYSKVNDYSLLSDKIHVFNLKNSNYKVNYVYTDKITDTLYEYSYLDKKDKYALFLDNNHPLIEITNENIDSNKEILVIKDSYANSFIPFLINHYKKVHVIDPRYYNKVISDYVKENSNIKDVLILYNMNTLDKDTGILTVK